MAFDWKEYLELARFLQGQSGMTYWQEAASRSAVSRAYYAAYCHARNYARDREGFLPSGGPQDHGRVRGHFQASGRVSIASDLDDLRRWRNDCDYDDVIAGDLNQLVGSAPQNAQDIIEALK